MRPHRRLSWRELLAMGTRDLGLADDEAVAVYLIDIDRLKAVNDVLGYESGDEVLRLTEHRIAGWAAPRGFVARVAGDMFAAIRPGVADADEAAAWAGGLRTLAGRADSRRRARHHEIGKRRTRIRTAVRRNGCRAVQARR